MLDRGTLEAIARDVLEASGLEDPPVDAFELAARCGLEVRWARVARGARLDAGAIYLEEGLRHERQHGLVAHEVGHWSLDRARERNTEQAARFLAGALLLPRMAFEHDLRETMWNLVELHLRHPNASFELIARRIVSVRDAVCVIVDNGKVTSRVDRVGWCEPWLSSRGWKLVDEVLATGAPANPANLCWAVPVVEGDWKRVVLVAERRAD